MRARSSIPAAGPTVEAEITLVNGVTAAASVPSGASTGKAEAVALRDGGAAWGWPRRVARGGRRLW